MRRRLCNINRLQLLEPIDRSPRPTGA